MCEYSFKDELNHPNTPLHIRRAANTFLFTLKVELNDNERRMYCQLVEAASQRGQSGKLVGVSTRSPMQK